MESKETRQQLLVERGLICIVDNKTYIKDLLHVKEIADFVNHGTKLEF